MTLIEVLAALVILGTMMVTFLVSQSQSLAQQTTANHRRRAVALAAELLAQWRLNETPVTQSAGGAFGRPLGWSWRRDVERSRVLDDIEMYGVTLTVHRATIEHRSEEILRVSWLEPVSPLEEGGG